MSALFFSIEMGTKWHLGRWVIFHDHEVDTGLEDIDLRLRDGTSRALRFVVSGSSLMVVG